MVRSERAWEGGAPLGEPRLAAPAPPPPAGFPAARRGGAGPAGTHCFPAPARRAAHTLTVPWLTGPAPARGGWTSAHGRTLRTVPPPSPGPAQRRRGPGSDEGGGGRGGDSRSPPLRVATSLTYRPAQARSGDLAAAAPAPPAGLGMRLARLLRGAASAGPGSGLRAASPAGASRSLSSDSGSGPAPESGVPGQVDFYARFSPSPLSMKQFLDFGEWGPGLGPLCAALRGEMRPLTRPGPGRRGPPLTSGAPPPP